MDVIAIALFFWARWLGKQSGLPTWVRFLPPLIVVAFTVSLVGTGLGLLYAFRSVDAAQKASHLAAGITLAMRFTAGGLLFDAVVCVILAVFTLRRPRPPRD